MEINSFFDSFLGDVPFIVWVIWLLVFIFIFVIFVQIILLKILRFRLRKQESYHKKQELFYENLLIAFLVESYESDQMSETQKEIISKIKKTLNRAKNRKIFINTLIKIKGEISGETIASLDKLFEILGLTKRALSKLSNRNWHIIALGIRDLRMFNVKEAKDKMTEFINHPNTEIRRQVYLYFISVFGFEGLKFLDNLKGPITYWTQIRIMESLKNIEFQEIPNPKKWLDSENEYVVLLALELVRVYNLLDNTDSLMQLINHKSEKVRLKTISIFTDFYVINAKSMLIENFDSRTKEEQLAIFKFLEEMATSEDEDFILKQVTHPIFEIKVLAFKILNSINNSKFLEIKKDFQDENNRKIIQFIENN